MQTNALVTNTLRVACFAETRRWQIGILAALVLCLQPGTLLAQVQPLPPELVRELKFTIREIRVEGNTLVGEVQLQGELKRFHGNGRNLDDLNAIRAAIAETYRAKGYELLSITYDAPRSRSGIHTFVVHEVKIGQVRVTGNNRVTEAQVRNELPSLREGTTPRLGVLARELFLFNDNPSHTAALEYSQGAPGVTDVEIKVAERESRRVAFTLNNTGTQATGVTRLGLYLNDSNFLARSHQVAASVTTSDRPGRVFVAGFSYLVPLPSLGDQAAFTASYSDVDSGRVADLFNISGKGTTWSAHYLHNLSRSSTSRHTLDMGYDERHYRDVIDFFGTNLGADVTARPLSAGYRYSRLLESQSVSFGATLQQNLSGGSNNNDAAYAASRVGARANWQSWLFDAAWQREFSSGWMPLVRLNAQHSNAPLISSEQFGLGGLNAVRGFNEREGAGDRGWRTNLELYSPRIADNQRLLAFVDTGATTRLDPLPGELASQQLTSYGLGWRAQFNNGLSVSADGAAVSKGTALHPQGGKMLHVSAAWVF